MFKMCENFRFAEREIGQKKILTNIILTVFKKHKTITRLCYNRYIYIISKFNITILRNLSRKRKCYAYGRGFVSNAYRTVNRMPFCATEADNPV